ncbi:hypothetical protein BDD12DRAFT_858997 [Trichophaea hybrida]|nr:hypothetical protein BDD12DRAFT_858997 [Trichophaea hybrida]
MYTYLGTYSPLHPLLHLVFFINTHRSPPPHSLPTSYLSATCTESTPIPTGIKCGT